METIKTKSAAKSILPKSSALEKKILDTMAIISKVVGATLGPGGHPILLERQEYNLPPLVTKDGVTVFRSLGFEDPFSQNILEAARDASVRTAQEAGDGTTTATILSEAFVRYTTHFCKTNPTIPPIRVVKAIQKIYQDQIVPAISDLTIKCDYTSEKGRKFLHGVAKISGNGDEPLADAVMECFRITGDEGNVTIVESTGDSKYEVEKIEGFPIPSGYEESCAKFYPVFINDPATQRVVMEKPIFLLYFGRVSDFQTVLDILDRLNQAYQGNYLDSYNIVLLATGFSESVIATLASLWVKGSQIKVFPLVVNARSAVQNAERHMLDDLAAVVGAEVFDPLTKPIDSAVFEDVGNLGKEEQSKDGQPVECWVPLGVKSFECGRYRSTIVGHCNEEILLARADEVKAALANAESEYDKRYIEERLAKLTGGIARLKVLGSSNGELKERRDRAEDAVCAVRGAIKHGAVVGGGWTSISLAKRLQDTFEKDQSSLEAKVVEAIINPSLMTVVQILLDNAGFDPKDKLPTKVAESIAKGDPTKAQVLDLSSGNVVRAVEAGLLDSTPALRDALRNAISIATLLGTLGGIVSFPRDHQADISEARDANEFARMSQANMADERG